MEVKFAIVSRSDLEQEEEDLNEGKKEELAYFSVDKSGLQTMAFNLLKQTIPVLLKYYKYVKRRFLPDD